MPQLFATRMGVRRWTPLGPTRGGKLRNSEHGQTNANSINAGSLAPADIEGLKPEIRPKVGRIDTISYKLRLEYQWVEGEWKLRRLDNLTFEKR
jgi:hypothetical protein